MDDDDDGDNDDDDDDDGDDDDNDERHDCKDDDYNLVPRQVQPIKQLDQLGSEIFLKIPDSKNCKDSEIFLQIQNSTNFRDCKIFKDCRDCEGLRGLSDVFLLLQIHISAGVWSRSVFNAF